MGRLESRVLQSGERRGESCNRRHKCKERDFFFCMGAGAYGGNWERPMLLWNEGFMHFGGGRRNFLSNISGEAASCRESWAYKARML